RRDRRGLSHPGSRRGVLLARLRREDRGREDDQEREDRGQREGGRSPCERSGSHFFNTSRFRSSFSLVDPRVSNFSRSRSTTSFLALPRKSSFWSLRRDASNSREIRSYSLRSRPSSNSTSMSPTRGKKISCSRTTAEAATSGF